MGYPKLSRRRFIPDEIVDLNDDEIILCNNDIIVTRWRTIKPRKDFVRGYSCYYLKKGYKISKFIDANDECKAMYCDIIETVFLPDENRYVFNDLLIDLIIFPGGGYRLLDLDEVAEALDKQLVTLEQAKKAMLITNELLNEIYANRFDELIRYISDLN